GLGAIYRQAGLFLTNKENFVANSGDFKGTEINSDRQLWSVAGNLAMVYRIFFGMQFEEAGIRLRPVIPEAYADARKLSGFRYRQAVLNLEISGWGSEIEEVLLDGERLAEPLIPADLQGEHNIEIRMANEGFTDEPFALVKNHVALPTPECELNGQQLKWQEVTGAVAYQVWRNGELQATVTDTHYPLNGGDAFAEWGVMAVDAAGWPSYLSEPLRYVVPARQQILEAEQLAGAAKLSYAGYRGKGFITLSKSANTTLDFVVQVAQAGEYLLDVRYSNGSGPVNTDNKAAIRSLYVGDTHVGPIVMPQLGSDEWSNWGFSNPLRVQLQQGENRLQLRLMPWNENMNVEVNTAMLDYIRLARL
ncbi:MAG: glycogen debranching protein, partial [Bacteroidetes bacterium]|nr:glycogen debranching protein [Bacteroidota bacterium]